MRNDEGGEKGEERISDRYNRRYEVHGSILVRLNGAICNCGYGTEEKQGKKQSAHHGYKNFETGNGKLS